MGKWEYVSASFDVNRMRDIGMPAGTRSARISGVGLVAWQVSAFVCISLSFCHPRRASITPACPGKGRRMALSAAFPHERRAPIRVVGVRSLIFRT